jgi:hypothetical protein
LLYCTLDELSGRRITQTIGEDKLMSKWGHWIATLVSAVSFVISIIAFYFSTLQQVDDLRLDFGYPLGVDIDDTKKTLSATAKGALTFINAGNRAAAITRMDFYVFQPDRIKPPPRTEGCLFMNERAVTLDFTPFVVKPGEIVVNSLKSIGIASFPFSQLRKQKSDQHPEWYGIRGCISFEIATPDSFDVIDKIVFANDGPSIGTLEIVMAHTARCRRRVGWN